MKRAEQVARGHRLCLWPSPAGICSGPSGATWLSWNYHNMTAIILLSSALLCAKSPIQHETKSRMKEEKSLSLIVLLLKEAEARHAPHVTMHWCSLNMRGVDIISGPANGMSSYSGGLGQDEAQVHSLCSRAQRRSLSVCLCMCVFDKSAQHSTITRFHSRPNSTLTLLEGETEREWKIKKTKQTHNLWSRFTDSEL